MSFAALGSPGAHGRGETAKIARQRPFSFLGPLPFGAGWIVSIDRLIVGMWKDHSPNTVGNALRTPFPGRVPPWPLGGAGPGRGATREGSPCGKRRGQSSLSSR
jgi:hypothetical protein